MEAVRSFRTDGRIAQILATPEHVAVHETGNGAHRIRVYVRATATLAWERIEQERIGLFQGRIALHPGGRLLFTSFPEAAVEGLDIESGACVHRTTIARLPHGFVQEADHLVVAPSGDVVYFVVSNVVFAWTLSSGGVEELPFHIFAASPNNLLLSPSGDVLWADGHTLFRFELPTHKTAESRLDDEHSSSIALLASCDQIALAKRHGSIELWSTTSPATQRSSVRVGPDTYFRADAVALRNGALIAVSCADQCISILEPEDTAPRRRLTGPRAMISTLASDNAETLWVGDDAGVVWCFDLASERFDLPRKGKGKGKPPKLEMTNHYAGADHVIVTRSGHAVSCGGWRCSPPDTRDLCCWDRGADRSTCYRAVKKRTLGYNVATAVGDAVVLEHGTTAFEIFDASTLKTVASIAHGGATDAIASRDGRRLITTGSYEIRIWSVETWDLLRNRRGREVPDHALAWLTDEALIGLEKDGSISVFEGENFMRRVSKTLGPMETFAVDSSGTLVACSVWDVSDTRSELGPRLARDAASGAYPPYLHSLAAEMETSTRTVKIWNVKTDSVLSLPRGTQSPVFTGDGVITVLEEKGGCLLSFASDGTEIKRIDLRACCDLAGRTMTSARAFGGARIAIIWDQLPNRKTPFPRPSELAVFDVATGTKISTHIVEGGIGPIAWDGDALVHVSGRAQWIEPGVSES